MGLSLFITLQVIVWPDIYSSCEYCKLCQRWHCWFVVTLSIVYLDVLDVGFLVNLLLLGLVSFGSKVKRRLTSHDANNTLKSLICWWLVVATWVSLVVSVSLRLCLLVSVSCSLSMWWCFQTLLLKYVFVVDSLYCPPVEGKGTDMLSHHELSFSGPMLNPWILFVCIWPLSVSQSVLRVRVTPSSGKRSQWL